MKRTLKLVGYWHDEFAKNAWPDPAALVDPGWEANDRQKIVQYLRSGLRIREYLGYAHCRFEGGPRDEEMGNADLSDGVWLWPEGLWIYVDRYSVRLPDPFVAHMRASGFQAPEGLDEAQLEEVDVDLQYWEHWSRPYLPG